MHHNPEGFGGEEKTVFLWTHKNNGRSREDIHRLFGCREMEKIAKKLDEKMRDCSQLGVSELQEREDRKTNVIINIPESEKSTAEERIEDDTAKIQAVLGEIKEVHTFKQPIRLGQKPRPLKIRFKDGGDVSRVLKDL